MNKTTVTQSLQFLGVGYCRLSILTCMALLSTMQIWDHIFNKAFAAETKGYPVLLTEPPLNPKANREKTTEVTTMIMYIV